ncbi:MAG: hypothetical protein LBQ52_09780 [Helicobacteraceae bacterium]|nr:hypothetical protein [Helicobacteraceae bacterium]
MRKLKASELSKRISAGITKNIAAQYGSLMFWSKANGFKPHNVLELAYGRTKGTRFGSESYEIKQRLIADGLWDEPKKRNKPKAA